MNIKIITDGTLVGLNLENYERVRLEILDIIKDVDNLDLYEIPFISEKDEITKFLLGKGCIQINNKEENIEVDQDDEILRIRDIEKNKPIEGIIFRIK